jgi:hypothetical protein
MPDEELSRLAGRGELRKNHSAQIKRMFRRPALGSVGPKLHGPMAQTRDVEALTSTPARCCRGTPGGSRTSRAAVDASRNSTPSRGKAHAGTKGGASGDGRASPASKDAPQIELDGELRRAFRLETEKSFAYVMHEDRRCWS